MTRKSLGTNVGRATAQAFARKGARIGLLARGKAGLDGAADDVRKDRKSVV